MPWPALRSLLAGLQRRRRAAVGAPDEVRRAHALVAAVDAGGLPLNPALVNRVARGLGLEVSRHASMDQTVERIRAALRRIEDG